MNGFASLFIVVVWLLAVIGWVMNIVKLIGMAQTDEFTTMFVLRCVGVLAAPFGCILGWF